MKKLIAIIIAAAMVTSFFAVPVLADFTAVPSSYPTQGAAFAAEDSLKTPDGYNEHDYLKLLAFLEITDESGVKNGEKLSGNYNPDDPGTWGTSDTLQWTADADVKQIKRIDWGSSDDYSYNLCGDLDLSDCTSLEELVCNGNTLSALYASGCTTLVKLDCSGNQLNELSISGCTELANLKCFGNLLCTLDISDSTVLTVLDCSDNQLNALDVSGCSLLTELYCFLNMLSELDVSNNAALEILYCDDNQLSKLDLSGNTSLTDLDCFFNQLTHIDLSGCSSLTDFQCFGNLLTELDVSGCTSIVDFDCSENQLLSLDVSKNSELAYLYCYDNQLTQLDVSRNTKLCILSCYDNELQELDLNNCQLPGITSAIADGNGWVAVEASLAGIVDFNSGAISFIPWSGCLHAEPMPNCTFEGWYTPDGELISTDMQLEYFYTNNDDHSQIFPFATTDFVARFSDSSTGETPTPPPTSTPTPTPTAAPTPTPTANPTADPTATPTVAPVITDSPNPGAPGNPGNTDESNTPVPSTGSISLAGIGIATSLAGSGIILFRKRGKMDK